MRKETIAKIQIIFGILLIITAVIANYYFKNSIIESFQQGSATYLSTASDFARENKTSGAIAGMFVMGHSLQAGIAIRIATFLAVLLDLAILAQAVMLILNGLKYLAKE
ncbi:MAG: hypothetical protein QW666_00640 [Candidatus Woesearchaeota archaeon]